MKFWQHARKAINSLNKFKVILLYRLLCFCIGFIVNHSSFVSCFGVRGSVWSRTKASQEKESVHLPPNSLSSEYVEDAGDTGHFFLQNFADTGSACSNMEYEQSIDNSSTNASTLSVSVFVFVCVYACLCFCPFMCVLVYLSLYVCMCLGALCTMLGLRMQLLWALSPVKQPSAENRQRLNMQDEVKWGRI